MSDVFWKVCRLTIAPLIQATWRVRVKGGEHIPKKGPAVLASNHLSFLDHFILPLATWRTIYFISKAEHFEQPVKSWFFKRWGVIPLKRGAGDQDAFERALQVLREGELFGIYPEGTRSLDGKLHKGRTGVARIAIMAQAPIIPAAMVGTFQAMPKGQNKPRFNKLEVRLGPPIDVSPYYGQENDREVLRFVTDEVMRAIQRISGQEYVDEYQFNPAYAPRDEGAGSAGETETPQDRSVEGER